MLNLETLRRCEVEMEQNGAKVLVSATLIRKAQKQARVVLPIGTSMPEKFATAVERSAIGVIAVIPANAVVNITDAPKVESAKQDKAAKLAAAALLKSEQGSEEKAVVGATEG